MLKTNLSKVFSYKEVKKSHFVIQYNSSLSYDDSLTKVSHEEEQEIVLNFSILNDYYGCPYRFKMSFFYGFIEPLVPQMGYGRSLHNIVMNIHRIYEEHKKIEQDELSRIIEDSFYLPYAPEVIKKNMYAKAEKATNIYVKENSDSFDKIIFAEKDIEIDLGNNIRVNGRMDLVKRLDTAGETTHIVDFKTADRETYLNVSEEQLKIYALGYQKLSGETADFIEFHNLDENDIDRKELSNHDLDKTEEKLVQAANEIRKNALVKNCSVENCSTCYMAHLCLSKTDKKKYKVKPRKRIA